LRAAIVVGRAIGKKPYAQWWWMGGKKDGAKAFTLLAKFIIMNCTSSSTIASLPGKNTHNMANAHSSTIRQSCMMSPFILQLSPSAL